VVADRSNDKDYDLQFFKVTFTNAGLYTNSYFCYKLSLAELIAYIGRVSVVQLSRAAFYYIAAETSYAFNVDVFSFSEDMNPFY
jgi:hypothetical protein